MLVIENPKQSKNSRTGRASWFPYYAGFSEKFARAIIASACLSERSVILDPWNGSGTTTFVALERGHRAIGIDINPAMVVAAKARCMNPRDASSLVPLANDIVAKAVGQIRVSAVEPLTTWFTPSTAVAFRNIDYAIQELLLPPEQKAGGGCLHQVDDMSDLAAFFYIALFRIVRRSLQPFFTTNPTWVKRAKYGSLVEVSEEDVNLSYVKVVGQMAAALQSEQLDSRGSTASIIINCGSSEELPLNDSSVDLIVTSPPYCTRIDYAVAAMPELAVLGHSPDGSVRELRRKMMGTSTVPQVAPDPQEAWGSSCLSFLENIRRHGSKASSTYYYKNHLQYYGSMYSSLKEILRVMRRGAKCALVIQDSYYKEIHNDLPSIVQEMVSGMGGEPIASMAYPAGARMGNRHAAARKYGPRKAIETVFCFEK